MLDTELRREATRLLSTAIAEIMEDEHAGAVSVTGSSDAEKARALRWLGMDVAGLAEAIAILVRRSGPEVRP